MASLVVKLFRTGCRACVSARVVVSVVVVLSVVVEVEVVVDPGGEATTCRHYLFEFRTGCRACVLHVFDVAVDAS